MKFANPRWRFESPGPLPDAAVYGLLSLAKAAAAQGPAWDILEAFKQRFPGVNGYWKSSEEKYVEEDLARDMRLGNVNAPLFIESFANACSDIQKQGYDSPGNDAINGVLRETQAGYQIEDGVVVARILASRQEPQFDIDVGSFATPSESFISGSFAAKTAVRPLKPDLASHGGQAAEAKPKPALRVFLCHSSGDKPAVTQLYKALTNDGYRAWLDAVDLLPGQDWEAEIKTAVRTSHIFVVCLSKGSVTRAGFGQKEIKFALDVADEQPEGRVYIIPARLEECTMPERLKKWHWVNLYEDDGYAKLLASLKKRAAEL